MYVNFFAVLVAAVVGMGVGWLWYSPYLLGEKWKAIMGTSWEDAKAGFTPMQAMGIEFISILITSFVLANLAIALNVHGPFAALRLGFWIWLGFQATLLFSSVLFERRPLVLFYINAGQRLVALLLMALIVGLWH